MTRAFLLYQFKQFSIMNSYGEVEELYQKIKNTRHPLVKELTAFHVFQENFRNGAGDVVYGLQRMDEMVEEINSKLNKK